MNRQESTDVLVYLGVSYPERPERVWPVLKEALDGLSRRDHRQDQLDRWHGRPPVSKDERAARDERISWLQANAEPLCRAPGYLNRKAALMLFEAVDLHIANLQSEFAYPRQQSTQRDYSIASGAKHALRAAFADHPLPLPPSTAEPRQPRDDKSTRRTLRPGG